MKKIVLAVGGNSLISAGQKGFIHEQRAAAHETCTHLAEMVAMGHQLVVAHGNGPQVGNILLRAAAGEELHHIPQMPMDVCVADSQGGIGYMLQQSLENILYAKGIKRQVATIITQVAVDPADPAFKNPTKPVGQFFTKEQADKKKAENPDWTIIEDAGRGYRRVVPSPQPQRIIERKVIEQLVDAGVIVIAVGGGGVPVIVKPDGMLEGTAAVIDKDNAACVLAANLKADYFIISTDVPQVYINYKKPDQLALGKLTLTQAKEYLAAGHFAKGSMEPKVRACVRFVENGGEQAIITNPASLCKALAGETGTHIVRG